MKVVSRVLPLKITLEVRRKPVPFTLKVSWLLPAGTLVGAIANTEGIGFEAVTTRSAVFDTEPSGLTIEIGMKPGVCSSEPGTAVVSLPHWSSL